MLDNDAKKMLALMKQSGAVPGAVRAEAVGVALGNLQDALKADDTEASDAPATDGQDDEQEQPVALGTRAYPLLQLLEDAQAKRESVRWDYDHGIV